MRKLIYLLFLTLTSLSACSGEFVSCSQKAFDAHVYINNKVTIPLQSDQKLMVTNQAPHEKYIVYNPYLGLALLKDTAPFKHPYTFNSIEKQHQLAIVFPTKVIKTKQISDQVGLNHLAKLTHMPEVTALLSDGCCHLQGVVTPNGMIEKAYLIDFINNKRMHYSDIGIRIRQDKKSIVVSHVDPFYPNNPFKVGDVITQFNKKKCHSASLLAQKILLSEQGSKVQVAIKRDGLEHQLELRLNKRFGGGLVSDTFLERLGFYFNDALIVTKVTSKAKQLGVRSGDKLIRVNQKDVSALSEVAEHLKSHENSLLFKRKGFEFNLQIK